MAALSPDGESFLAAARKLSPHILGLRQEIEDERRLPRSLVEKLRESGLLQLWLPEALGGTPLPPLDVLCVIEELAGADGSTAWCVMNSAVFSLIAGSLAENAAREVFGERSIVAGSLNPSAKAIVVEGGYRVSGRWSYGSGITHSDWTAGNCVLHDQAGPIRASNGAPQMKLVFFPTSEAEIFDTWRVGGLRGTGSHDFAVENLFVPAERAIQAFATNPVQPGVLYRVPTLSLFCVALAAVTFGIARSAVSAFVELAAAKTPMGSQAPLREKASAQTELARAEAMLRAARAGVVEAVRAQWGKVEAGGAPSLIGRAGVRLATTFGGEASLRAIELVYNAAGGSAIYESGRLDRCFRDARVAVQHIGLTTNTYELAGKVLLGLEPGTPRF